MFFHPDLPLGRMLQLPNGSNLFEFIDGPFTGTKRLGAMFGARNDQHDVFADRDFPIPMDDEELDNVEILQRPFTNLPQLFLRHPLVILEGDAVHLAPLGAITGNAQKRRNPADPFRAAAHPIEFLIDGEILPLHAYKLGIIQLAFH